MEITNRNLGVKKILRNSYNNQGTQQPQTEPIQQPQAPAFKGGLAQAGKYGTMLLGAVAAMTLASCEKTSITETTNWYVTVEKNTEKLEELAEQAIAQNKEFQTSIMQALNTIIALLNSDQAQDAAFQQKVLALMAEFQSMLTTIINNQEIEKEALNEGLALYNKILNATLANGELLAQYGNEITTALKALKGAIESGNTAIISAIELMWADLIEGNTGIITAIKNLSDISQFNNEELIKKLTEIYENKELSDTERTEAIIEAINQVKATIEGVKALISNAQGDMKAQFEKFLNMYNNNEITSQKLMELIYNAIVEGNTLDKLELEQLHKIYVSLQKGDLTSEEIRAALAEIQKLLGEISTTLKDISAKLNDTYNAIINLNNDMKNGNKELGDKLDKVIANQEAGMTEFKKAAADQQERTKYMQEKVNEAVEVLYKIYANTGKVTMDDLKAILKENNAAVIATIEAALKDLGITIDNSTDDAVTALINAMKEYGGKFLEGYKQDIDTIINLLSSIDLNTSLSNTQKEEIIQLIKDYKALVEGGNATQAEIAAKLNEIRDLLESIDTTVKAIYDKVTESVDQFNKFYADYKADADKLFAELANANRNLADIKTFGANAHAKLDQVISIGNTIVKELEQIKANQGDDITVQDLKDLSADNFAKLEAMLNNLGLDAKAYLDTKLGDFIAVIKASTVDLTTTNNLLQTVIDLVGNISATMPNNAELNTTMSELLAAYKAGNADLAAKLDAATTKLQAIYEKVLELFAEVADLVNEFKTYKSLFQTGVTNVLNKADDLLANLKDANSKLASLEAAGAVTNKYLENLNIKGDEAIALLENLGANGGQGLTKAQLEEVLKDAGVSLAAMLEDLGISINDNTNNAAADIVAAIRNNKIDLTTTNNMLQTIIDSVGGLADSVNSLKNKNVTIDTSNVETKLDSLLTAISSGNTNVQAQMDALKKAIDDLTAEIKALAAQQNQGSGSTTP